MERNQGLFSNFNFQVKKVARKGGETFVIIFKFLKSAFIVVFLQTDQIPWH